MIKISSTIPQNQTVGSYLQPRQFYVSLKPRFCHITSEITHVAQRGVKLFIELNFNTIYRRIYLAELIIRNTNDAKTLAQHMCIHS